MATRKWVLPATATAAVLGWLAASGFGVMWHRHTQQQQTACRAYVRATRVAMKNNRGMDALRAAGGAEATCDEQQVQALLRDYPELGRTRRPTR